jgi:hypothetical protein
MLMAGLITWPALLAEILTALRLEIGSGFRDEPRLVQPFVPGE